MKAFGIGLKLRDFPDVKVMNMDPAFLEILAPKPAGEKLQVQVAHIVPAAIMGSGWVKTKRFLEIMTSNYSTRVIEQYGLEDLRLGDLVAIIDADHCFGRIYRQGAITVGIVVHTNCVTAGHGPGVTTLMTSTSGKIILQIDSKANIATVLKLRADI